MTAAARKESSWIGVVEWEEVWLSGVLVARNVEISIREERVQQIRLFWLLDGRQFQWWYDASVGGFKVQLGLALQRDQHQ